MLWAVSNALKAVKIRMVDPEFKMYANRLFKATAEKWRAAASGDRKSSTSDAMLAAAKSLVEEITGRKMSPKSAKKTASKSQKIRTPEKTDSRDENNPPFANTSDSMLSETSLNENGVLPLERVGILAEKLDPGGNVSDFGSFITPKKSGRVPCVEECFDPDVLTSRKRKRQETERLSPKGTEIMVSQRLRSRTPCKTVADLSSDPSGSCQSTVSRIQDDPEDRLPPASPTAKRQKLESVTPVKSMAITMPVRQSPRLLSSRTPLKSLTEGTPSKTSETVYETPSKRKTRCRTPSKPVTTIDETPVKPQADITPLKSTIVECGTPTKSLTSGYDTVSRTGPVIAVSPLKLLSEFGTPSKSRAVRHPRRILTPTFKTHTPLKQSSSCPDTEAGNVPDTTSDGASLDHLTPSKKCVTFEDDAKPISWPGASENDDKPPVLRPVASQRRSVRCFSADLPPPKLVREIGFSPPPVETDETDKNLHSPDDNQTRQTPVPRRRASAPTPGQRFPAVAPETSGGRSGRKKVSLSLSGARKSKTPENAPVTGKPVDDVTLTPRRSARRATEVPLKSSPN